MILITHDQAEDSAVQAKEISERFQLSLLSYEEFNVYTHENRNDVNNPTGSYILLYQNNHLSLIDQSSQKVKPIVVDFESPHAQQEMKKRSMKTNPLIKAVLGKSKEVNVLDCTTGLGQDSFSLAMAGCSVTSIERHPAMAALFHDALQRCRQSGSPTIREAASRIELIHCDAISYLDSITENKHSVEVIYLDPMHPEKRKKSASPKKELSITRKLVGQDRDAELLMNAAVKCTPTRIVVKRPDDADQLSLRPDYSYKSKMVRFDVYQTLK